MTVPHITITQEHYAKAWNFPMGGSVPTAVDICNKAIEIALAEQEKPLISAEEARNLGAGKAEFLMNFKNIWSVVGLNHIYHDEIKYRAIKQPEPVESKQVSWTGSRADVIALLHELNVHIGADAA